MAETAALSLFVVSDELNQTLNKARIALEDAVEQRNTPDALRRCAGHLHEVRGVLQMVEVYGAALLAEEMEASAEHLAGFRPGSPGHDDGLDALTRSMVQLPVYLERMLAGGRDIALVLLPLLNDLRAVRGKPLLSESTLLLLNTRTASASGDVPVRKPSGEDVVAMSAKLRPAFQLALLGWIKGQNTAEHLGKLARVAEALERAATTDTIHQLWWVVGGVLEGLADGGLTTSVSIKRLLGQADREIKRLIDSRVEAYEKRPPEQLLNNLLYYVARATGQGEKVTSIRKAFNLDELIPGDKQVEDAREGLHAPGAELMQTVAAVIREDLARVKDVLDIYVRTGGDNADELAPQLDLLKKISDTLGVLGLGDLRGDIQTEIARLRSLVDSDAAIDDATLIQIAATLLKVEDNLDRQLKSLIKPADADEDNEDTLSVPAINERDQVDYQQVTHAVVRECLINLARLKEAISRVAANNDDRLGIDSAGSLMRGVTAGLMMLGKVRAMEVSERILACVDQMLRISATPLATDDMDRLADTVVSLEYYLETIQLGRRDPWYMLDNAETCLDYLETLATTEPAEHAQTQRLSPDAIAAGLVKPGETEVLDTPERPEIGGLPVVADGNEHVDPELLELFIEESREEIESIENHLPRWADDPEDNEALITIRRSFHTLKGSGRMVGAERMGEYCWSVEDLLNRLINKTLRPTPPMIEFVREATQALPDLVEQIEIGTEPPQDLGFLMSKAHAFAEGNPNAATMQPPDASVEAALPEMDPVLRDIFSKEAASHTAVIRDFVAEAKGLEHEIPLSEAVHRACHTLHGSANMANAERVLILTSALNGFARRLFDRDTPCSAETLGLFSRATDGVETLVAEINAPEAQRANVASLVAELTAATDALTAPPLSVVPSVPPQPAPPADEPSDVAATEVVSVDADAELAEIDSEIAEIFGEEATELLEASDEALQRLAAETPADVPLQELKRHLHTLKGGARMAGLTPIGDLAHELESVLIAAEDGRTDVDDRLIGTVQRALDELHRMRDTVVAGQSPDAAAAMHAELAAYLDTPAAADDQVTSDVAAPITVDAVDNEQVVLVTAGDDDTAVVEMLDAGQLGTPAEPDAEVERVDPNQTWSGRPELPDAAEPPLTIVVDEPAAESDTGEPVDQVDAPDELVAGGSDEPTIFEDSLFELAVPGDDAEQPEGDSELDQSISALAGAEDADPGETVVSISSVFDNPDTVAGLDDFIDLGTQAFEAPRFDKAEETPETATDDVAPESDLAREGANIDDEIAAAALEDHDVATVGDDDTGEGTSLEVLLAPDEPADIEIVADDASVETPANVEVAAPAASDEQPETGAASEIDTPIEILVDEAGDAEAQPAVETPIDEDVPVEDLVAAVPPPQRDHPGAAATAERQEYTRVDAELLEDLLNAAGEISIFHSRLSQQVNLINFNLSELEQTVSRLRGQLRKLELETETQIINRHQDEQRDPGFDPLEMDRYSLIQQLSRALAESASDVGSIKDLLQSLTGDADTLLIQQARVTAELQDGLMRTRMVPFSRHVARLTRLVRQTAQETGKQAELNVEGASGELDRQVLEKMLPPFEHMLRNSVIHGIEDEAARVAAGKSRIGGITVRLHREGSEMVIDVADDGAGLNVERIRQKALERGLVGSEKLSDEAAMELILTPGFSTADSLTQSAGRGVGMDVVANEVKKLGGSLKIASIDGQGTNFTIRLPFTLAITQALIVRTGDEIYALPLPAVEGVARVDRGQLNQLLSGEEKLFEYGERAYRLVHLGHLVGGRATELGDDDAPVPLVLVRKGDNAVALLTDEMLTSREIVVKSVGPQLAAVRGIAGATILGDGSVVLIIDPGALIGDKRSAVELLPPELPPEPAPDRPPLVLVVDDSITVRRVTERFLLRQGLRAVAAKDGIDAIAKLEEEKPAVILLDIEMPRMDGYEFATHVRNDSRFADTPIIMITSRVSEKHRARAIEIGVNDYLGKPYQDHQLLETIRRYLPAAEPTS
ncbi:MAG: Hpt domain-containing protein [Pseudomonadota bacterium]